MRDAGGFAEWVVAMQAGMRTGAGSDVPCDGCVACCTSGQTIVVDADEAAALPPGAVVDGALARHGDRCALLDAEKTLLAGLSPADRTALAGLLRQLLAPYAG